MKTTRKLFSVLALSLLASSVMAAVSPEEAAKLGTTLTPLGAERCLLRTGGDALDWLACRVALLDLDFDVLEPPELIDFLAAMGDRIARGVPRRDPGGGTSAGVSPEAASPPPRLPPW